MAKLRSSPGDGEARKFAAVLRTTILSANTLRFGNFRLRGKLGVSDRIQYNRFDDVVALLGETHEYTFPFGRSGKIQLSLQLYENSLDHYRLFAYTRVDKTQGMTFSVNLTTNRELGGVIFLEQVIAFKEQYPEEIDGGQQRRRQKQLLLCDVLRRMGMVVEDDARLILGVFDPVKSTFLDADVHVFLNNFMVTALLKGHFQGNKGYELDMLPSLQTDYDMFASVQTNEKLKSLRKPKKLGRSSIPLAMRYRVLARDNSTCCRCGRGIGRGVILHVDHKTPVSLGGGNSLENLWVLCSECNLGKGNRVVDGKVKPSP